MRRTLTSFYLHTMAGRIVLTTATGIVVVLVMWNTLDYWHPQTRSINRIEHWGKSVAPQIAAYEAQQHLHIAVIVLTAKPGTVGIRIDGAQSQAQVEKTKAWVQSLEPPGSVRWMIGRVTEER